jgi:hypothetical protein
MSTEQEQIATIVLSPIAFITGWLGLTLADVDLIMAIGLKAISMVSVVFIILVNWDKAVTRIKKFFK